MMHRIRWFLCALFAVCWTIATPDHGWAQSNEVGSDKIPYSPKPYPSTSLPNAFWVQEQILSGGMPHGQEAFDELQELGIKTVISVDAIRPDVASAEQRSIRYVHLPHGYDGISAERVLEIAKAIRDLPKPIYIHCHHGKHRGPTAAAAGCVTAGLLPPSAAKVILERAGTNPAFKGLYATALSATPASKEKLDAVAVEFRSIASVPAITESMVSMDEVMDRMKKAKLEQWHPASGSCKSDALLMKEYYVELHRSEVQSGREFAFFELLVQGAHLAEELEVKFGELEKADTKKNKEDLVQAIHVAFKQLESNCSACHQKFRDNTARAANVSESRR